MPLERLALWAVIAAGGLAALAAVGVGVALIVQGVWLGAAVLAAAALAAWLLARLIAERRGADDKNYDDVEW
ncbi:MAG: hypothetical protein AAGI51_03375 [Pseudomonadota bacterium]